jgi:hypothetical protein
MAEGNELTWEKDGHAVTVQLRIVSQPGAAAPSAANAQGRGSAVLLGLQLPSVVAGVPVAAVNTVALAAGASGGVALSGPTR